MASSYWKFSTFDFVTNNCQPKALNFQGNFRLAEANIPRQHGIAIQTAPYLGPVNFNVEGTIYGTSATTVRTTRDSLISVLSAGRAALYAQHSDRYIMATCSGFQFAERIGSGTLVIDFNLGFLADDPFWESTTQDSYGYTTNANNESITGGGNAPSPPTITVTAPAGGLTRFDVNNDTTGKTFRWDGSLTVGQTLIINMENKSITENGAADMSGLHSSAVFWNLNSGANSVDFTSTPTEVSLTLTKRARWYPG